MALEPLVEQLIARRTVEAPAPAQPPAPPGELRPAPSVEQVQTADGVFSDHKEADLVANLLGMQFGVLLLHDLAIETFSTSQDEEEQARRDAEPREETPEP
jgi:hypothetical protein